MNATKILDEEIKDIRISSLPTIPTAPSSFGGIGYSSVSMKYAFDRLSLFIIERFNLLIDDLSGTAFADNVMLTSTYSLKQLYTDIRNGNLADMIILLGKTLTTHIDELHTEVAQLRAELDALSGKEST